MRSLTLITTAVIVSCFFIAGSAHAAVILQPAGVTSTMGEGNFGSISNLINKSGLSLTYTSGVTDFTTYIASNPAHNGGGTSAIWDSSGPNKITGVLDFDLGGPVTINALALWNRGGNSNQNAIGITLLGDDNAAFSSPDTLGSYTADPNTGPLTAVLPDVFSFTPTTASFLRLQITSNNGGSNVVLGEVAFSQVVPEPSGLALTGLAVAGLLRSRRRQRSR
jgi:hypothetical protein